MGDGARDQVGAIRVTLRPQVDIWGAPPPPALDAAVASVLQQLRVVAGGRRWP